MVLTGGITRLTHSGLSMVNWNFIVGSLPPISEEDWQIPFGKYKLTPEFRLINSHFTLTEFKSIFWWEYSHRFIGRLIGIVFLFPFFWFVKNKSFTKKQFYQASLLLLLGIAQGFIGWFMVKSGLNRMPNVSHFRLALHLGNAFLLFYFSFSFFLSAKNITTTYNAKKKLLINLLPWIILIQIVLGALVSGLKAGYVFNTYPLMDGQLIPARVLSLLVNRNTMLNDGMSVQFLHRIIAFVVLLSVAKLIYDSGKDGRLKLQDFFLGCAVLVQFALGITTLVYSVPLILGILHQIGAFVLFSSAIYYKQISR